MALTIVLADNDIEFLGTRSELLKRAGFRVNTASSVVEARQILEEVWVHVAILDVRLEDDHDEDDITGIKLAGEARYEMIPKIIVTGYPSWERARAALGSRLEGPPPADHFLARIEGIDALVDAIRNVANSRLGINWALATHWGGQGLSYASLVGQIDPALTASRLVERAEELEDLLRMLFSKCSQITVDRVLWRQPGRIALVVFAFYEGAPGRQVVVTCGQKSAILRERDNLSMLDNANLLAGNLHASDHKSTLHFAANAYELRHNSDLETIRTFEEVYRQSNPREINDVLQTLIQTSLNFWHSKRRIMTDDDLEALLRQRFNLGPMETVAADFEAHLMSISRDAEAAGLAAIDRSPEALRIHLPGGIDYSGPDPISWLTQGKPGLAKVPVLFGPTLGDMRADTILIDSQGRTWLSDFGELGEGPILADFAALETSIKFDLAEGENLVDLQEMEQLLMAPKQLDGHVDSGPLPLRKAMSSVQRVRSQAVPVCGGDFEPYLLALAHHAVRRILSYDAGMRRARRDILPAVHACLSLCIILDRLSQLNLQRHTAASGQTTGLALDEANRQVTVDGRAASLSPLEFNAVHYLWQHAGQLCSRAGLFKAVYGGNYQQGKAATYDAQLNMLIMRVREEIELDAAEPRYLVTKRGKGFVLYPQGKPQTQKGRSQDPAI